MATKKKQIIAYEGGKEGLLSAIAAFFLIVGIAGAGADILRLLKKQNGLPFGGHIPKTEPICTFTCSECSATVYESSSSCPSCKAKFDLYPTPDQTS
ncbi:hypothetical protein [Aliidiomarina quisquiliarum]|uniref:hypothetical protein n=1 Tax=Aliidiomarina quisquiliarum TaxID=2938947 RepID=UPI00208FCB49|nr:hypothetical protein [Aliidiomarina quisquiliarum]MCO4320696.1 hypothetical protein [Aliidiomarina quisquiliarum]